MEESRTSRSDPYRRIDDWSQEGRRRLVAEHGDEIRLLLDESFASFADRYSLAAFGFRHGDDPVEEAVEFAIERFVDGELDVRRLGGRPTFCLFTQVQFWLSQKVGAHGFRETMNRLGRHAHPDRLAMLPAPSPDPPDAERAAILASFMAMLGKTLCELHRRTCADLVGFWLSASEKFRARVFDWQETGALSDAARERSTKACSLHEHDALFRFLALYHGLVPDADEAPASRALVASMFSSCPNKPPGYRIDDDLVAERLRDPAVRTGRSAGQCRKIGLGALLSASLARVEAGGASPVQRLEHLLGLVSLGLTTLHAYRIEDAALASRLRALPRPPPEIAR